ncbi:fatty acid desaturase-domain-containing protein [Polychytrium aggregatum]|uniref:fatty acid desaturase-domain-containing protein n=1 Tax=Polychytrium aggregatum TaxID=110093 RepID=UPI0022FF2DBB|nr:fatty acid desaturase-domain-containing protein [Polychytrium aggregatum]KAI9203742.1 fatty acid desaturase-domain-containing protein [Polychytrium aggregatum]
MDSGLRQRPAVSSTKPVAASAAASKKRTVPSAPYSLNHETPKFTLKDVRDCIPPHLFKRSLAKSFATLAHDLIIQAILWYGATYIDHLPHPFNWIMWPVFWVCQGVVWTGVWVIAHECGHQAFSDYAWVNNLVGWVLHSALLVPYFSWKITHSKHHKATCHLTKDQVFVPYTRSQFNLPPPPANVDTLEEESIMDDIPILNVFRALKYLFIGWPAYLLFNASGQQYKTWTSHFRPNSPIFEPKQWLLIVYSDIGFALTVIALIVAGQHFGSIAVFKYYVLPYLGVNFWLVFITFLQHTDSKVPHYDDDEFTFLLGALATVDRDYGVLNYFHHHIADTHVVHHLFSTMPHYNAVEATEHVKKFLGKYYLYDDTNIFLAMYRSVRDCKFVEDTGRVRYYKN